MEGSITKKAGILQRYSISATVGENISPQEVTASAENIPLSTVKDNSHKSISAQDADYMAAVERGAKRQGENGG